MHTGPRDTTPVEPAPAPWWWLAMLAPILVLFVARPWHPGAFPVWDFAEMLPILREADSLGGGLARLSEFTRAEGRANYLTYLQVAATWMVAGDDPVRWQWQRAVVMLLLGATFVVAARRLGATPLAAATGALLLVCSKSGIEGWLYLSGEPLAAIGLLAVVIAGRGAPTRGRMIAIALAALGTMLAKEVVGVLLPVALGLALVRPPADSGHGAWSRAHVRRLSAMLALVLLLETVSVVTALRDATVTAYAMQFQFGIDRLVRAPQLLQAMLLPVKNPTSDLSGLLYPANLVFLVAIAGSVAAWWTARPRRGDRGNGWLLGVLLASAPAIGAVTYSFWPRYSAFYGIPFALGGAGLVAMALTILARHTRARLGTVLGVAVVLTAFAALDGARTVAQRRAFADLALAASRQLGRLPSVDSVLVVKAGPGRNRWPITGPELQRYAGAVSPAIAHVPVIRDATCSEVAGRLRAPLDRMGILNDQNACGPLPTANYRFRAAADHIDWWSLSTRPDTMTLELLTAPDAPR